VEAASATGDRRMDSPLWEVGLDDALSSSLDVQADTAYPEGSGAAESDAGAGAGSVASGATASPSSARAEEGVAYRGILVSLDSFDGPLDLLLHLIQKDEIDIYDIPIAHITRQYLEHLDLMQELDLEIAGEYLVMAATLIRIKSQLLIPTPTLDEEGEEVDPREELVHRLIEYRKFKMVAGVLKERESERLQMHPRQVVLPELDPEELPIGNVSVFDLVTYMRKILEKVEPVVQHDVELEPVNLEDRIEILRARLAEAAEITFSQYLRDVRTRMGIIVSFMALLEMAKLGELYLMQDEVYGEILLIRRDTGGRIDPDA